MCQFLGSHEANCKICDIELVIYIANACCFGYFQVPDSQLLEVLWNMRSKTVADAFGRDM